MNIKTAKQFKVHFLLYCLFPNNIKIFIEGSQKVMNIKNTSI